VRRAPAIPAGLEPVTRSAFLVRSALAVGAAAGAAAVGPWTARALAQSNDAEIVNFALTLEYLEATYYTQALERVDLGGEARALTQELADNESQHVQTLRALSRQLGTSPVDRPRLDFGDAYASQEAFLKLANTFEDTGVSAYNGAGPLIRDSEVLAAAGTIVQVEGRHAALVRILRDRPPAPLAFDPPSTMDEVLEAVDPFLDD